MIATCSEEGLFIWFLNFEKLKKRIKKNLLTSVKKLVDNNI